MPADEHHRKEKVMCNGKVGNRYERLFEGHGIHSWRIKCTVLERDPYTVVALELDGKHGVGFSKRCPRDKHDRALGKNIAYGRAMRDLWEQVGW